MSGSSGELAKITLRFMQDGRKRFNGRLGVDVDDEGRIVLETSFGRFAFAFDEIESGAHRPDQKFWPVRAQRGTDTGRESTEPNQQTEQVERHGYIIDSQDLS